MSAALLRTVPTAAAQVVAVWRAMPGAYLVLGRASGPIPKSGSVRIAGQAGSHGMFRSVFWPLGEEATVSYLTVIRLPDRARVGAEPELVLRGARGADRDFTLRLTPICEEEDFGQHLATLAGASAASVARFILDLIRPEAEVDLRRPILLLESFLQHAALQEGCVELILGVPNRILLLQGWGRPTGDHVEIILTGSSVMRHSVQVGEFSRIDIQAPLTGSILALPIHITGDLTQAKSIFLLTPDTILCRRIIDNRVLDPSSSMGQIRHLLPRLQCPPTLIASLQHALRPQYEGVDTLNNSERRVRTALDWAVSAEDKGVFLSGWLFDPAGQVSKMEYCTDTVAIRIDVDMVRIDREDVLAAFKSDPSFPRPARSDFGFAVYVPLVGPTAERPHLRITFSDDGVAFMSLATRDAAQIGLRAKLCGSVDMHKPSGMEVIQRHLAPFLANAKPPELTGSTVAMRGPIHRPHAIVVPLTSPTLPRAAIANLLGDPLVEQEQMIFVCGPEWGSARTDALIELLQSYELPATLITYPDAIGPLDAVLAASRHSQAETFMIVSPIASGGPAGSRQTLRDALIGADAVCPTILYEDGSVRFAGSSTLDFTERAPFTRMQARWLGLSAKNVLAGNPVNATGGTLECCLLSRDALASAERARRYSTKFGQEAALFSELHARGARVIWVPGIGISTAEESEPGMTSDASALVDRWSLRASWGESACAS